MKQKVSAAWIKRYISAAPQASAEKVKEVTAFSKECLEKIEEARVERDYQQVQSTLHTSELLHFRGGPCILLLVHLQ